MDDGPALPSLSVVGGRTDPSGDYKDRPIRMTPEASFDSGLDVVSVRKLPRRAVPRVAWQVFGSARHVHNKDVDYTHDAKHVLVTSPTPFPVQVDGDSLGDHRRLEITLAPEALWVIA